MLGDYPPVFFIPNFCFNDTVDNNVLNFLIKSQDFSWHQLFGLLEVIFEWTELYVSYKRKNL